MEDLIGDLLDGEGRVKAGTVLKRSVYMCLDGLKKVSSSVEVT